MMEAGSEEVLSAVREKLVLMGVDALVVPSGDPHASEYPPTAFARRAFVSGFTGSAGVAVVTSTQALLWTDGRYFVQAEQQLSSKWTLMKQAFGPPPPQLTSSQSSGKAQQDAVVPTIEAWLARELSQGAVVAVDAYTHTITETRKLRAALEGAKMSLKLIRIGENPIDSVWGNQRPALPCGSIRVHPQTLSGKLAQEKLTQLAASACARNVNSVLLSALDEVAWMLNIRGSDIEQCQTVVSYLLVHADAEPTACATWFVDSAKVSKSLEEDLKAHLSAARVKIAPYESVTESLSSLAAQRNSTQGAWLWCDPASTSVAVVDAAGGEDKVLLESTPVPLWKSMKNANELSGIRAAHVRDGAALCKFLAWLSSRADAAAQDGAVTVCDEKGTRLTEFLLGEKLLEFRRASDLFVATSFDTIAGAGPNGAIIHYRAERDSARHIVRDELLLLDSGAQYIDGTTDITRTVCFGKPPADVQSCFTRVLQGHIALETAVFPKGTTGLTLDAFARMPLWQNGLDYRHGTGHGVGAALNVHEGPQGISARATASAVPLEPGMIVSNEPGYYRDGEFGIRIESIVEVVKAQTEHRFGERDYLTFENITYAPIQRDLVCADLLSNNERAWLNEYHAKVHNTLYTLMETDHEREWLRAQTEPL